MKGQPGPGVTRADLMFKGQSVLSLWNLCLVNQKQPCCSIRVDCLTTLMETAERYRMAAVFAQQDVAAIVDVDLYHLVTEQVKKNKHILPPSVRLSGVAEEEWITSNAPRVEPCSWLFIFSRLLNMYMLLPLEK